VRNTWNNIIIIIIIIIIIQGKLFITFFLIKRGYTSLWILFVYTVAFTFKVNHTNWIFGYDKTYFIIDMGPHKIWNKLQVCRKQLLTAFHKPADNGEWNSTVHVNSGVTLHCSGRTGSDLKVNALKRVRPG